MNHNNQIKIEFYKINGEIFNYNLDLIDSNLPIIIYYMLIDYYSHENLSSIDTLTEHVTYNNPLNLKEDEKLFYKHKILELLKAFTLGMLPTTKWDGKYTLDGGYDTN